MEPQDDPKHSDNERRVKKLYDELEEAIRRAERGNDSSPPGKETLEEFLSKKASDEESEESGD